MEYKQTCTTSTSRNRISGNPALPTLPESLEANIYRLEVSKILMEPEMTRRKEVTYNGVTKFFTVATEAGQEFTPPDPQLNTFGCCTQISLPLLKIGQNIETTFTNNIQNTNFGKIPCNPPTTGG